ncbi:MAG: DUF423 domain-containing protein [Pseudomonadota bacterium]
MRGWIVAGALNGFLAVALGAFGAHGLEDVAPPERLAAFETGARYHLAHAVAILLAALFRDRAPKAGFGRAAAGFALGCLLFSGSLYVYGAGGPRWAAMITPLGGLAFLAGWALLAIAGLRTGRGAA